jgi:hypothetical protein
LGRNASTWHGIHIDMKRNDSNERTMADSIARWQFLTRSNVADLMATVADMLHAKLPENAGEDSVSILAGTGRWNTAEPIHYYDWL